MEPQSAECLCVKPKPLKTDCRKREPDVSVVILSTENVIAWRIISRVTQTKQTKEDRRPV